MQCSECIAMSPAAQDAETQVQLCCIFEATAVCAGTQRTGTMAWSGTCALQLCCPARAQEMWLCGYAGSWCAPMALKCYRPAVACTRKPRS